MDAGWAWHAAIRHLLLASLLVMASCAGTRFGNVGMQVPDGLVAEPVHGAPFQHLVLANAAFAETRGAWRVRGAAMTDAGPAGAPSVRVHVYLDGDGAPWRGGGVAEDPSPRGELVRRLLQRDTAPALYLGRPCHFTRATDPACTPADYTFGRYSERVLDSLAAALAAALAAYLPAPTWSGAEVVLIGHSGGGSLAVLLAGRWQASPALRQHRLVGVLTLAANLDVGAWTSLHGYTPLHDSLDPALQPALPRSVRQLHLVGGRDRVVPEAIVRGGLRAQPHADVQVFPGFDHACCWLAAWPATLGSVEHW